MNKSDIYIHDAENYPNFFSNIFKKPEEKHLYIIVFFETKLSDETLFEIVEGFLKLGYTITLFESGIDFIRWFRSNSEWYVGYNSYGYDDPMIEWILNNYIRYARAGDLDGFLEALYAHGNRVIFAEDKRPYQKVSFNRFDTMRVSGLDRIFKPLKQAAANLKHEKIQDLPIKPGQVILQSEIPEILFYELNDVIITEKLLIGIPESQVSPTTPKTAHSGLMKAIQFREEMGEHFGLDILNYNKSQIGSKIAAKMYSEVSGRDFYDFKYEQTHRKYINYSDVIFDNVSFKTKQLQDFLVKLKGLVYEPNNKTKDYGDDFKFEFEFFKSTVVFAQGGIHGTSTKQKTFDPCEDSDYEDLDAASFYPFIYDLYEIYPEHLEGFTEFIRAIITLRLEYKHGGNKLYANGLKLAINRIYGGFSDIYGWLYDVKALLQTTINGQLFILMLAEELELSGIEVYYYNTDGITVKCPKNKRSELDRIWKEWEAKTRMELEADHFKKCFIRDVNNFVNIKTSGEVKVKGAYEYTGYIEKYGEFCLDGSFDKPIVAFAAVKYLVDGIPLSETIHNHRDIYDFCTANKTGKQFQNQKITSDGLNINVDILQQSIRFYVSNTGAKIFKVKAKTEAELEKLVRKSGKSKLNMYSFIDPNEDLEYLKIGEVDGKWVIVNEVGNLWGYEKSEYLSYNDVCKGYHLTLFNDFFDVEHFSEYNINYDYYISEAQKLIDAVKDVEDVKIKNKGTQLSLF